MANEHKLKPEFKAEWLKALRSGEYKQVQGCLRDVDGFCCLGVACDVAAKMGLVNGGWEEYGDIWRFLVDGYGVDSSLPPRSVVYAVFQPETNLLSSSADIWTPGGKLSKKNKSLYHLNDEGKTFAEIADIIERDF